MSKDIVSHGIFSSYDEAVAEIKSRIADDKHLNKLLIELEGCPFGRFLIQNRGLDAYWTKRVTENKGNYFNDFEHRLVTEPLAFVATQFRSLVFKNNVADLKDNSYIMSVPAGLLPEFTKDLVLAKNFKIDAYDLDSRCIDQTELSKLANVEYIIADIFKVDIKNQYDAVVSNGLNIYLESDEKVSEFYNIIAKSLKPGGILITSFLKDSSEQDFSVVDKDQLAFTKDVFADILNIGWKKTHKEAEFYQILLKAGLVVKEIIYDNQKAFPTVIALKK